MFLPDFLNYADRGVSRVLGTGVNLLDIWRTISWSLFANIKTVFVLFSTRRKSRTATITVLCRCTIFNPYIPKTVNIHQMVLLAKICIKG